MKKLPPLLYPIIAALLVRVAWLLITDNSADGDAITRLQAALDWANHPVLYPNPYWLPGHYYFTGGLLLLFQDLYWMPRVVHLVFGVATLAPFYGLIRDEFDEYTALCSAWVVALLPMHIELSTLTLTEPVYLFFLFTALYYINLYRKEEKLVWLLTGALAVMATQLLRYEGWLLTAMLGLWLWLGLTNKRKALLPAFLFLIVPGIIMLKSFADTGDPLWSVTYSDVEVLAQNKLEDRTTLKLFAACVGAFPIYLLPFLPVGIWACRWHKLAPYWGLLVALPYAYSAYKVFNATLPFNPRYFIAYALLALPYMVYGALYLSRNKSWLRKLLAGLAVVYFLLLGYFLVVKNERARFGSGFYSTMRYVAHHLKDQRVLTDQLPNTNEDRALILYSKLHELSADDSTGTGILSGKFLLPYLQHPPDNKAVGQLLINLKMQYIVLFKNGELNHALGFSNASESLPACRFRLVFEDKGYRVYQITCTP